MVKMNVARQNSLKTQEQSVWVSYCCIFIEDPKTENNKIRTPNFESDLSSDHFKVTSSLSPVFCHLKIKKKLIQSSPGFPQNYPNGVNCVYRIVAGAGLDVILTFTALDIEADAQCRWDSLAINFQLSGQSNTVCGNLVSPNGFTANPLTGVGPVSLTMTADDGVNGGGFQINYEIINPDPCIGG